MEAAQDKVREISSDKRFHELFCEGKMLGVLWCEDSSSEDIMLYAFSGNVGGMSRLEGFVDPLLDLLEPGGYFLEQQELISELNREIAALESGSELSLARKAVEDFEAGSAMELEAFRERMAEAKKRREEIRSSCDDESVNARLNRESSFLKAEYKRMQRRAEEGRKAEQEKVTSLLDRIDSLKEKRRLMSDRLQRWIFDNYKVMNALGEELSVWEVFEKQGLVPPGGTGDCALPKLLNHAYRHGLRPLAFGEFWYGDSPASSPRIHGHFYPSCTSKCGPLLPWMLQGLDVDDAPSRFNEFSCRRDEFERELSILYYDEDIIVALKPAGLLSVAGLTGRTCLMDMLGERFGEVFCVHRLDMDTSGVILFARNRNAQAKLHRQFESRSVHKSYQALLAAVSSFDAASPLSEKGVINLPLAQDFDNKPAQKVDFAEGKEAVTLYEFTGRVMVGDRECFEVRFYPQTGRTHQLRLHAAHASGLGMPILGDRLYGGLPFGRMCLHAAELSFNHPLTGERMHFCHPVDFLSL